MSHIQVSNGFTKPVIAALGLTDRDRHLVDYWLGEKVHRWELGSKYSSTDLLQGLHYFPTADLNCLEELVQYYLPLIVVARLQNDISQQELFSFLYKIGIAALWLLPNYGAPVVFPQFQPVLSEKRVVFLIEENISCRKLLRQIFYLAGYHVQVDFRSAQEVLIALENSSHSCLLLLSLDHSTVNYAQLLPCLESYLNQKPKRRSRLRMMFTKDFSIPGLSFNDIESLLQPHARRIFSLSEAIFALADALFSTDLNLEQENIDRVLYGSQKDFFHLRPSEMTQSRRVLFLWLYQFMAKGAEPGITLEETKQ